jgi:hypothetical protein
MKKLSVANTGLTANVIGVVLLSLGIAAEPETIRQVAAYLELLGIVIAPTKITAVLGLIGLVINQVLLAKKSAPKQIHTEG